MGKLLKNKMSEIKKYIDDHIGKIIYVNEIANIFNCSFAHFVKKRHYLPETI